ncbi:unnamed protein product [Pleuronectes platessa]|uniref:Uncharacterized protein n=1 Tax=Pleuronectes platessa TaxID=8262 RepID=A0A9N7Y8M7_PLEPL|nr:unnamed protein product [Pleuronectes platessa]
MSPERLAAASPIQSDRALGQMIGSDGAENTRIGKVLIEQQQEEEEEEWGLLWFSTTLENRAPPRNVANQSDPQ